MTPLALLSLMFLFGHLGFAQKNKKFLQNIGWFIGYDPSVATP